MACLCNAVAERRYVVLFLVALTAAFVATLIIFAPPVGGDKLIMNENETRRLTYSSFFTKKLGITDSSSSINVYHLSSEPPLSSLQSPSVHEESILLSGHDYIDYEYYLHDGTQVDISFFSTKGSYCYIFLSDQSFKKWINNNDDESTYLTSRYTSNSAQVDFSYKLSTTGSYHFVFWNQDGHNENTANVSLSLNRLEYNFEGMEPACKAGFSGACEISIDFFGKKGVYLEAPLEGEYDDSSNATSTRAASSSSSSSLDGVEATDGTASADVSDRNRTRRRGKMRARRLDTGDSSGSSSSESSSSESSNSESSSSKSFDLTVTHNTRWWFLLFLFFFPQMFVTIILCLRRGGGPSALASLCCPSHRYDAVGSDSSFSKGDYQRVSTSDIEDRDRERERYRDSISDLPYPLADSRRVAATGNYVSTASLYQGTSSPERACSSSSSSSSSSSMALPELSSPSHDDTPIPTYASPTSSSSSSSNLRTLFSNQTEGGAEALLPPITPSPSSSTKNSALGRERDTNLL